MSTSEAKKVKAVIVSQFHDAGTEETFYEVGAIVEIEAGAFANYEAAGLVEKAEATSRTTAKAA